ncbi:MAG: hypothetical protein MUC72_10130 [Acidobacteria bacterium]|nr:hypothetical protein [Acidobacteriota bacterium]
MNKKRLFAIIIMLAFFAACAGAAERSNWVVGVNSGWSLGLGEAFQSSSSPHWGQNYDPVAHLGVYAATGISRYFALRLQMTFQGIARRWTSSSFYEPTRSGTDLMTFCAMTLDGVLGSRSGEEARFFFQSGGGFCYGGWDHFKTWYFTIQGGPGVRFPLKRGNRSAIVASATFHSLFGAGRYRGNTSADFVRATLGYEGAVSMSGN